MIERNGVPTASTQNEEVETNNKRVSDNQYDHLHAARLIP
jgi:hypothetical protein